MTDYIKSDSIVLDNGMKLTDILSTFAKDIDYVRYLPLSIYKIEVPAYTVDTSLGDTYQDITGTTVTKLTNHAPNIFPAADNEGKILLSRYYTYIFLTETRVTGSKAGKTATSAEIGIRWRLGTLDSGTNIDSGYHTINVASQFNRFSYTFTDVLISKAGDSYRNEDNYIYPRYLNSSNDLDLQYTFTRGIVIAIPENGVI